MAHRRARQADEHGDEREASLKDLASAVDDGADLENSTCLPEQACQKRRNSATMTARCAIAAAAPSAASLALQEADLRQRVTRHLTGACGQRTTSGLRR